MKSTARSTGWTSSDTVARRALELGARLIISSDAHDITEFENLEWGVRTARRAWATKGAVLTTQPLKALRASLRRNQSRQPRKRAR